MSNIEHINELDTLNTGRNKINLFAIDPANRAENNSIIAKDVANQSNQTSNEAKNIAINTDDRLDNMLAGELQDGEVIDARKPFGEEAFPNLGKRLDDQIGLNSDFREFEENDSFMIRIKKEQIERGVNPKWFLDENNQPSLKNAIDYCVAKGIKNIKVPPGNYNIANLYVPDGFTIKGSGMRSTILNTPVGADGIIFGAGEETCLSDLTLNAPFDETFPHQTVGIRFGDNGGRNISLKNVRIRKFESNLRFKGTLFSSTFDNVFFEGGNYNIYAVGGQSNVANVMTNCFFNRAVKANINIENSMFTFVNCNFGGRHDDVKTVKHVISKSDFATTFIGCNFEGTTIPASAGALEFFGKQNVALLNCIHQITKVVNNGMGFDVKIADTVALSTLGTRFINSGVNVLNIRAEGSSKLINVDDNSTISYEMLSTRKTNVIKDKLFTDTTVPIELKNEVAFRQGVIYPTVDRIIKRIIIVATRAVSNESIMPNIVISQGAHEFLNVQLGTIGEGSSIVYKDDQLVKNVVTGFGGALVVYCSNKKQYATNDAIQVVVEYM